MKCRVFAKSTGKIFIIICIGSDESPQDVLLKKRPARFLKPRRSVFRLFVSSGLTTNDLHSLQNAAAGLCADGPADCSAVHDVPSGHRCPLDCRSVDGCRSSCFGRSCLEEGGFARNCRHPDGDGRTDGRQADDRDSNPLRSRIPEALSVRSGESGRVHRLPVPFFPIAGIRARNDEGDDRPALLSIYLP